MFAFFHDGFPVFAAQQPLQLDEMSSDVDELVNCSAVFHFVTDRNNMEDSISIKVLFLLFYASVASSANSDQCCVFGAVLETLVITKYHVSKCIFNAGILLFSYLQLYIIVS